MSESYETKNEFTESSSSHTDSSVSLILNLAAIVQITDLDCDNPGSSKRSSSRSIHSMIIPRRLFKTMTLTFARSAMETREVGTGEADKKAVHQSWRFRHQL